MARTSLGQYKAAQAALRRDLKPTRQPSASALRASTAAQCPELQETAMAYRIERDFLGEKQIPADVYYGVQTLRGMENFHITGIPMSQEPNFVKAFG